MVRIIKVENRPQIKKIIHYVKPKKSSGYDEIRSEILKACASLISHPLSCHYMLLMYPSRCKISSTASSSCICVKNNCHRVKTQLQLNKYYTIL